MTKKRKDILIGVVITIGLFTAFTTIMYMSNQKHYISTTDIGRE